MNKIELTAEEIITILEVARRAGKDRDGDILHLYVHQDHGIVLVCDGE